MTIRELYEWAYREGVEDCELVVRDRDGWQTSYIEPTINHITYSNGIERDEVEL